MFDLILPIVFAHLLGDFVFQSTAMVHNIKEKGVRSRSLYLHVLIHMGLLLLLTGFNPLYYTGIVFLSFSHLIIDIGTKVYLSRKKISSLVILLIDQSLHALSIAVFVYFYQSFSIDWSLLLGNKTLLLASSLVLLIFAIPILIKKCIEWFNFTLPLTGLENAGKYIGILERLFIFFFVVTQRWEGIGFLLAAKSIFRFGDLKVNKDIKMTEYILIGTLLSFGLGIAVALLYLLLAPII